MTLAKTQRASLPAWGVRQPGNSRWLVGFNSHGLVRMTEKRGRKTPLFPVLTTFTRCEIGEIAPVMLRICSSGQYG